MIDTLTYPGDCTSMLGEIKGPTDTNEYLTVVAVTVNRVATGERRVFTEARFKYGLRCKNCFELLTPDEQMQTVQALALMGRIERMTAKVQHADNCTGAPTGDYAAAHV